MSLYPNSTTAHFRVTQCCFLSSLRRPTPRFSPHACQSLAVPEESTQDSKCRRTSNRICSSSARIAYCLARGDSQQVSPPRLHSIHILYYTLIICCGLWKSWWWVELKCCGIVRSCGYPSLCRYLYFFDKGARQISASSIQGLLDLIHNEMAALGGNATSPEVQAFLRATIAHIRDQKLKGGEIAAHYDEIQI